MRSKQNLCLQRSLRGDSSAFTLIELIIVVAIIGVLVAILLPAVQAARESSRRSQCCNNLKQLALAVQTYETGHREYPPPYSTTPKKHHLVSFLLPYVEQQALFDQIDFTRHWNEGPNPAATAVNLAVVSCPTAPARDFSTDYAVATVFAPSAWKPLVLSGRIQSRANWLSILQKQWTTPAHVRDGLSNSILLFEDGGRPLNFIGRTRQTANLTEGVHWADASSYFQINDVCGESSVINCNNNHEVYSFHDGGAAFAFGDGSVRFLADALDTDVFLSLFTRAAGDVVSDDLD